MKIDKKQVGENIMLVCTMFVGFFVYLLVYRGLLHLMTPHIPIIPGDGFARDATITLENLIEYVIFTGFWEEMAFRVAPIKIAKIINPELLWPVIFISSIIFGWGHGGLHGLMFQGVMGLGFSYVYIKTKYSYISVAILHMMWNAFYYLML